MPCAGPSEEECRQMDRASNFQKYGVRKTDSEWAEDAACNMSNHLLTGVALVESTKQWIKMHQEKDKERKQEQKNRLEEKRDKEYKEFLRLKKKYG